MLENPLNVCNLEDVLRRGFGRLLKTFSPGEDF
jgi:hypothetical protein